MKVLLVGPAFQGKLGFACDHYGVTIGDLIDGSDNAPIDWNKQGIYRLHLLVRRYMEAGIEPGEEILVKLDAKDNWIVVCDEIGGGLVPVDPLNRAWREEVGRLCCDLAIRADVVEHITCGIPLRLKG